MDFSSEPTSYKYSMISFKSDYFYCFKWFCL